MRRAALAVVLAMAVSACGNGPDGSGTAIGTTAQDAAAPVSSTKSGATAAPSAVPTTGDSAYPTAGTDHSEVICEAIAQTQEGLGDGAATAAYLAQFTLKLASVLPTDGSVTDIMDDKAVEARCGEDYRAFLEQAGITSLRSL